MPGLQVWIGVGLKTDLKKNCPIQINRILFGMREGYSKRLSERPLFSSLDLGSGCLISVTHHSAERQINR